MKRDPRTIHLSDDVWERLKCEAERQERTLSATLERLLDKALMPCGDTDAARTTVRPATYKRTAVTIGDSGVIRHYEAGEDDDGITHEPVFD